MMISFGSDAIHVPLLLSCADEQSEDSGGLFREESLDLTEEELAIQPITWVAGEPLAPQNRRPDFAMARRTRSWRTPARASWAAARLISARPAPRPRKAGP
jgi:hypothetical protein